MPHVSYFWDEMEDNVVEEYDGDTGNTVATHTTEPTLYGSVLSQDRSGEKRYFQFDGLGNTTELTDGAGNVTDKRRYSAFGETVVGTGSTSTPFKYGGRWGYHASGGGPVSIRRRQYESHSSRWLSADPLGMTAHQGASLYSFVSNCPPSRVDPPGLVCYSNNVFDKANECTTTANTYLWAITWKAPPTDNGILVQRVSMTSAEITCDCQRVLLTTKCNQGTFESHLLERPLTDAEREMVRHGTMPLGEEFAYWEAWVVKDGKIGQRTANVGEPVGPTTKYGAAYDGDSFLLRSIGASRGDWIQRGNAYFVPMAGNPEDGFPGTGWADWRGFAISGGLPTKCADTWSLPANAKAVMNRSISARWSCCEPAGSPTRYLFVFPPVESGSQCRSSTPVQDQSYP